LKTDCGYPKDDGISSEIGPDKPWIP